MKVYKVLRNTNEDMHVLQQDLYSLEQWSTEWQLDFNTKKCEVMRISKKNDKSIPDYKLCGSILKTVSEVKILAFILHQTCHGAYKPLNAQIKLTVFLDSLNGQLGLRVQIYFLNCTKA